MDDWKEYLLKQRAFRRGQIEYLQTGNTTLQETTDGVASDVTAEWLDRVQRDFAEISQLLTDAGVPLDG